MARTFEENNYFVKEKRFTHQYNSLMKTTLCPGKFSFISIFIYFKCEKSYDTQVQKYHIHIQQTWFSKE